MIAYASAFAAGLLFGIGLWISGMATPRKVLDFLDVTGAWDPSLALVMAGAVGVTLSAFGPILKRRTPLYARNFVVSLKNRSTRRCCSAPHCSASAGASAAIAPGPRSPRSPI